MRLALIVSLCLQVCCADTIKQQQLVVAPKTAASIGSRATVVEIARGNEHVEAPAGTRVVRQGELVETPDGATPLLPTDRVTIRITTKVGPAPKLLVGGIGALIASAGFFALSMTFLSQPHADSSSCFDCFGGFAGYAFAILSGASGAAGLVLLLVGAIPRERPVRAPAPSRVAVAPFVSPHAFGSALSLRF